MVPSALSGPVRRALRKELVEISARGARGPDYRWTTCWQLSNCLLLSFSLLA